MESVKTTKGLVIEEYSTLIDPRILQLGVLNHPFNDSRLGTINFQFFRASNECDVPLRPASWWLKYKSLTLIIIFISPNLSKN